MDNKVSEVSADYSNTALKRNLLDIAEAVVATLLAVFILGYAVSVGVNKQEVVDCMKWQQQAKDYPSFYLTKWQDEQCKAHGIVIDAPVK